MLLILLLALGVVLTAAWAVYAANLPSCTNLCSQDNCDSFCASRGYTCVATEVGCNTDNQPYCHYSCLTPGGAIPIYTPGACAKDCGSTGGNPGGSPIFKKQPTNP
jgi:hypothetical protein